MEPTLVFGSGNSSDKNASDQEVWGMPKYEQNDDLANFTDEEYLAMVRN